RRAGWGAWAGWVAAAAVGMAFVIFAVPAGRGDTGRVVAQVDGASDAVSWPFAGTTEEFKGATGTVVWSSALQKGYMKLKGVPVNSPGASQYQLWIVDPQRDKNPVDGGVFDVAAGEVVVPIDAKLRVGRPAAFAITREKPGGVVVSAGPLLFVAKP
ncbi:MAG: anti-sigma factor, partial [Phycisphaerales bacterium]|nr:anti-sigma factor [Phycisphaerales bacterium]